MQQHGAKDLLGHVEEPDLHRATGVFAQALDGERGHSEEAQSALDE